MVVAYFLFVQIQERIFSKNIWVIHCINLLFVQLKI